MPHPQVTPQKKIPHNVQGKSSHPPNPGQKETPSLPPKTNSLNSAPISESSAEKGFGLQVKLGARKVEYIRVLLTGDLANSMIYNCDFLVDAIFDQVPLDFGALFTWMTSDTSHETPYFSVGSKWWRGWRARRSKPELGRQVFYEGLIQATLRFVEEENASSEFPVLVFVALFVTISIQDLKGRKSSFQTVYTVLRDSAMSF